MGCGQPWGWGGGPWSAQLVCEGVLGGDSKPRDPRQAHQCALHVSGLLSLPSSEFRGSRVDTQAGPCPAPALARVALTWLPSDSKWPGDPGAVAQRKPLLPRSLTHQGPPTTAGGADVPLEGPQQADGVTSGGPRGVSTPVLAPSGSHEGRIPSWCGWAAGGHRVTSPLVGKQLSLARCRL